MNKKDAEDFMVSVPDQESEDTPEQDTHNVETLCEHCVFADFVDVEGKQRQTGCQFDILSKMGEQGTAIKTNEEDEVDYFSIPGRVCVYNRHAAWADHFNNEGLKEVARNEVKPRIGFVVLSKGDTEKLSLTLASIQEMDQKPTFLCVAVPTGTSPSSILSLLESYLGTSVPYRVELILQNRSDERVIDICFKKFDGQYYGCFESGKEIPSDFITNLDIALNEKLTRFLLLTPTSGIHGLVVQRVVAKQVGGSNEDSIVSKLIRITEKQKCQHLVKSVTEIAPSLT